MAGIRIAWGRGSVTAELRDTPTSRALLAVLPCKARASTWGEEVYFELPVKATLEPDAQQVVDPGTVCFWVEGNALALPYGRSETSRTAPRSASRRSRRSSPQRILPSARAGSHSCNRAVTASGVS